MASFTYTNIQVYRLVMNVLYAGRYRRRFDELTALIGTDVQSVCDLCFADTVIADWCRAREIVWTGVDLNPSFCAAAERRGHRAIIGSVLTSDLPTADLFIVAGSLHLFHDRLPRSSITSGP